MGSYHLYPNVRKPSDFNPGAIKRYWRCAMRYSIMIVQSSLTTFRYYPVWKRGISGEWKCFRPHGKPVSFHAKVAALEFMLTRVGNSDRFMDMYDMPFTKKAWGY
jgi:hypothetical protein